MDNDDRQDNWKLAYPLFLLGMMIIGLISFFLIRRMERRDITRQDDEL